MLPTSRYSQKKTAKHTSPTVTNLTINTGDIHQITEQSFLSRMTTRNLNKPISPHHSDNLNVLPSISAEEDSSPKPLQEGSMVARTLSKMHLMKGTNTNNNSTLLSLTEAYQKDLTGALKSRLTELEEDSSNSTYSVSILWYYIGLNHMKLAHTNDIMRQDDTATHNREEALKAFDKAIELGSNDDTSALGVYNANKAKCLYNMHDANNENDTRLNEAKILAEEYSNIGVANETLGYIHTLYGNYAKALEYFIKSLEDPQYKAAHKILSLYDQTVLLAALGKKEEAIALFQRAERKKLPSDIDTEDKILITEIRTKKYKDYIIKLANSANNGGRLRSVSETSAPDDESLAGLIQKHAQELNTVTVGLLPGTKVQLDTVDTGLTVVQQSTSEIHKKIALESRPYLNDITKLQHAILNNSSSDINKLKTIQQEISANSQLRMFSEEIQTFLNAAYAGSQAVLSKEVAGQATNHFGWAAWGVSLVKDHTPLPIQLGLSLLSYGLSVKDDEIKVERATNFIHDTAFSPKAMESLAETIALRLTIIHKRHLDAQNTHANDHSINHQSKKTTFFTPTTKTPNEESRIEGERIAKFILSLIFDGRLKEIEPDQKAAIILGYIALHNEYYSNLPEHTTQISCLTLENIKTLHEEKDILWKTKKDVEGQFTRAVATNVANIGASIDINHQEMSTKLAETLSADDKVVVIARRTSKPWEKKASIEPKHFMADLNFFKPHVINTIQQLKTKPENQTITLNSNDEANNNITGQTTLSSQSSSSNDDNHVSRTQTNIFEEDRGSVELDDINLTTSSPLEEEFVLTMHHLNASNDVMITGEVTEI